MAIELELKLDIAPADVDRLAAAEILPGAPTIIEQHMVYFDTPDHALAARGLSLRVRSANGLLVQTVKAGGAGAGLFNRQEWEQPVSAQTPVLDDGSPVRLALGTDCNHLSPVFTIANRRRQWQLNTGDACIEVALDCGQIAATDRECHHAEVELELLAGDPAALFALALRLDAVVPLRPAVLAKAQRGYRLLGPAAHAVRAEPLVLPADATAGMALQAIVQACLRQYRLNEALLLAAPQLPPSPEALHQARVALRRLRSALAMFMPLIASDPPPLAELRWLAAVLGEVRDFDALLAKLPDGPLHHSVQAARTAAMQRAVAALQSARVRHLLLDIAQWLALGRWHQDAAGQAARDAPAAQHAAEMLARLRRKVKRRSAALDAGDDEARHELRKAAKKLRYAAEFLGSLFAAPRQRKRHQHFVAALEALQDELGALNDLVTARHLLGVMGIAHAPAARDLLSTPRQHKLLEQARNAHAALLAAKPFWP